MASNLYGRGDERRPSPEELKRQQSRDRYEDVNRSTRPGEVTMNDLRRHG
jgi:hypothetical protein